MLSNDILRSVRYILKANNNDLVRILALGNVEATAEQIAVWLRKEDEEGFQRCPDIVLSSFLNGLIYEKRGKDESAPALEPERRINNNIVLKKLRIAFSLKTDDILAILTEQQFRVSMPEITAMMRCQELLIQLLHNGWRYQEQSAISQAELLANDLSAVGFYRLAHVLGQFRNTESEARVEAMNNGVLLCEQLFPMLQQQG